MITNNFVKEYFKKWNGGKIAFIDMLVGKYKLSRENNTMYSCNGIMCNYQQIEKILVIADDNL